MIYDNRYNPWYCESSTNPFADPYSPVGGCGTGYSYLPSPIHNDFPFSNRPNPTSPAVTQVLNSNKEHLSVNLTTEKLRLIFPQADDSVLQCVLDELKMPAVIFELKSKQRMAHFLAQIREEAGSALVGNIESFEYSPQGLIALFDYYKKHPQEAVEDGYSLDTQHKSAHSHRKFLHHAKQEIIANKIYANRIGNGDQASGDGWLFRGRGFIQVTGRGNYKSLNLIYQNKYDACISFDSTPDLLANYPYNFRSAFCFWVLHHLSKRADQGVADGNVDKITAVVNKKTKSYGQRRKHFRLAMRALS